MRRPLLALLVFLTLAGGWNLAAADPLSISATFSISENVGPNSVGMATGHRNIFGSVGIEPPGPPTTATATQTDANLNVVTRPLFFAPSTLFPNTHARSDSFSALLKGSWAINATQGLESAGPVDTNPIPEPELIPLVGNLQVVGTGATPTVMWTLPDLAGFDVDRIRVRVHNDLTNDLFFQSGNLPANTTAFMIPEGVLQAGQDYVFRVMLEDTEFLQAFGTFTENRSDTFSGAFHVSEPGTLVLLGSGLVGLAALAWRRRG